jgi:hypothetical protein
MKAHKDFDATACPGEYPRYFDKIINPPVIAAPIPQPRTGWNEQQYINNYPDVKKAIEEKKFSSGWVHYFIYGQKEGRVDTPIVVPTKPSEPSQAEQDAAKLKSAIELVVSKGYAVIENRSYTQTLDDLEKIRQESAIKSNQLAEANTRIHNGNLIVDNFKKSVIFKFYLLYISFFNKEEYARYKQFTR